MARLNRNTELAEDVVQQSLLIAMAHASPPSEVQAQRAWLRGIAQNVIRSQLRSMRRGHAAVQKAAFEQIGTQTRSAEFSVKQVDEHRAQLVRALYLAVTELSQAEQDLFYAFYRTGRSHARIAAELGTTAKGVETRLYRLRSRLRSALVHSGECHL
jgi:RNA polymerase sigma-70 factor (ECF subfamily)